VKLFLWFGLVAILVFIGGVTSFVVTSNGVPKLDSEFDLEKQMKLSVEGERMSLKLGLYSKDKGGIAYERPDFSKLPKEFVAMFLSQIGCPTYFQTPREEGTAWTRRMFLAYFGFFRPGDGECERQLGMQVAEEIGITGNAEQNIAASRLHEFLQKDQLLAYAIAGMVFDRAVVGPDAASKVLFDKPLDELQLSEISELALALPQNGFFDELHECKNPSLLRQARDGILGRLAKQGLVPEERAKNAQLMPMACLRAP